jgi:hypothetical protein
VLEKAYLHAETHRKTPENASNVPKLHENIPEYWIAKNA